MKPTSVWRRLAGALLGFLLLALSIPASAEVLKIVVDDPIHPITDEYIDAPWRRPSAIKTRRC